MSTLDRLLDEKAIVDLTIAYCWALDTKDFEALRDVFLPDATALYSGRPLDGVEAVMARCDQALGALDSSQHIVANHQVRVDGDTATSRCYFHAQHVRMAAEGGGLYVVAGIYTDGLVRTPAGWRIRHRVLSVLWTDGNRFVVAR